MSYGYIYRTTCFPSGRVYIGQKRSSVIDAGYLGSGKRIRSALLKYGRPQFMLEVLEFADSKKELDLAEQKQICVHRAHLGRQNVYNITPGGEGCGRGPEHPSFGRKAPPEEREWRRQRMSGERNPMFGVRLVGALNPRFGVKLTQETKGKIAAKMKGKIGSLSPNFGRVHGAEMRARISAAKKGKTHPGKPHSEATKAMISAKAKARFASGFRCAFTPETRAKISEGRKRYWAQKKGGFVT